MLAGSILAAVTTGFPTTSGGQRHSSDTPTRESRSPSSAMISVALGRKEQMRIVTDSSPESLCLSCRFARTVRGRRGQEYLLCRNNAVPEKYPRQPVLSCHGYDRSVSRGSAAESSDREVPREK
jgi:hypothetical protein